MVTLIIASSNQNMDPGTAVSGNLEAHQEFLERAGYRNGAEIGGEDAVYTGGGFEWFDVRNLHNLFAKEGRIALQLAAAGDITSLHQSWRETTLHGDIIPRFWHPEGSWNDVPNTFPNNVRAVGRG